jgi:PleD family two-component response regulator
MPHHFRSDDKPVVEFDPRLELSPFTLFRRMREGHDLVLVDVRPEPRGLTLQGATQRSGPDWVPPEGQDVLLFDDDGTEAVAITMALQAQGHRSVRALFGGLQLYEFSLDPEVVGQETFLVSLDENQG